MRKHLLVLLPWFCMCAGATLNIVALTANHGVMPVAVPLSWGPFAPGSLMDETHVVWSDAVRLGILADWIRVGWLGMVSPGDCIMWFGQWVSPYGIGAWLALCWRDREPRQYPLPYWRRQCSNISNS